ncbi:MAG TPA: beta-ketoacyl-[acyl-carrier-protein] synthase family protein [Myxococcota bacterium]|nr:beta-ketoacyl-[acyl-carrier-protein] synthase family protein [Myxococcota bacterium]
MTSPSARRVVITGVGALSSMGGTVPEIWQGILDQRVGYHPLDFPHPGIKARFFGTLTDEAPVNARLKALPRGLVRMLGRFARYGLLAGLEATQQAFGAHTPVGVYPADACGVMIGTGWGGIDTTTVNGEQFSKGGTTSPFASLMSMNNAATAALSLHMGLRGYQGTPVAACASGAIAIGEAAEVIRHGRARCMLAGGSESLKELMNIWSIDILEALSRERQDVRKACCPFSLDRTGFVLSEGAAVVCLEDLDGAVARGAPILAEIAGYGNFSDAHDFTAPAPGNEGRVRTIAYALAQAGLTPAAIGYVNAHGTSTPLNDVGEVEALKIALGDAMPGIPTSSTKSYTGHLIGAAGALETIVCVKVLETGVLPATLHLDRPDPACDIDLIPHDHRSGVQVDACLNLSFGFGGANAALVVGRVR